MTKISLSGASYGHTSRAAFVTWAASPNVPPVGALASAGGFSYRYIGTGTAISDLPGWVPHGDIWLDHWGPDLTGATDDTAKLTAAFSYAGGKTLNLPSGIINWTQQATAIGTMGTGTVVQGQGIGVTILRMNVPSTAFARAFQWQNPRIIMRDFTFMLPTLSNCAGHFANHLAGDGRLERVRFEGGVTGTTSPSHVASVMNASLTTGYSNFKFVDCEFVEISHSILKPNTSTAAHFNIEYSGCRFTDCYQEGLSLNSPSGSMDGVNIHDCIFSNTTAHSATNMAIALATASNVTISNIKIKGPWWSAIHIEENVRNLTLSNVVAELTAGDFLDLTANNIGGTWYRPEQIALGNLTAEKTGTRGGTGIRLTYDGNSISTSDAVTISGGVLKNFNQGIQVGQRGDDDIRIADMTLIDCNVGIYIPNDGFLNAAGITFKGCVTAMTLDKGGLMERATFHNCTETHSVTAGVLELKDPKWNFGMLTFTASETKWFRLARRIARSQATATVRAFNSNPHHHTAMHQLNWDGTTETTTQLQTITGGGSITADLFLVNEASAGTVAAGGTGYTVNDVLTVQFGALEASGTRATFLVTSVSGGVVTGVSLQNRGEYSAPTANPATTTGGTGTGCTLNVTYVKTACARVFDSLAQTVAIEVAVSGSVFVQ